MGLLPAHYIEQSLRKVRGFSDSGLFSSFEKGGRMKIDAIFIFGNEIESVVNQL